MLHTTIQTRDENTGKELPVPPELLTRVRRAADILAEMLRKVTERINIHARWWFDFDAAPKPAVLLSLSVEDRAFLKPFPYPREALRDDDAIRQQLWTPIAFLFPQLDEVVDRHFESVRRGLAALTTAED